MDSHQKQDFQTSCGNWCACCRFLIAV